MLKTITRYGSIAGLIVGIPLFSMTMWMTSPPEGAAGMAIGYLIMLLAFSMIFLGIRQQRDQVNGGVIGFWPAFGMGMGIALVASLFYVAAWELALAVSGRDFAGQYADATLARARHSGMDAPEMERLRADMESFRRSYADPAYRIPMTFAEILPVGFIVSLISAALLRNSRFLPARRA